MKTEILSIYSPEDVAAAAETASRLLREGALVAFPTETVYGLAACVAHAGAMERLRDLKDRPARPFTVHIGDPAQAAGYVASPPASARRLMRKAWPGPVTIVLPTGGTLATDRWNESFADQLCYENTVALRLPDHPVAMAMLAAVEEPVVAPSANEAGQSPPRTAREVLDVLDGRIEMVIDAGAARVGRSSTIVRFDAEGDWEILREGMLGKKDLKSMMLRQMLFVCTGNTCRSPMAEGLARVEVARRIGCRAAELPLQGWRIVSAGVAAFGGAPATDEAVDAARRFGADISTHRNQQATVELINSSDLIFCMTAGHLHRVCDLAPGAADRVHLLDAGGSIPDPIGGSAQTYRRTAEHIRRAVRAQLDAIADL